MIEYFERVAEGSPQSTGINFLLQVSRNNVAELKDIVVDLTHDATKTIMLLTEAADEFYKSGIQPFDLEIDPRVENEDVRA